MKSLVDERKHLRYRLRSVHDDDTKNMLKQKIKNLTVEIGVLRKEVVLCENIAKRSEVIKAKLKVVHDDERKEESQIEHRRRCSRTSH